MVQKIKIQTSPLLDAVSKASHWANRKSPIPAISSIRFTCAEGMLEVCATDGESTDISLYIDVAGDADFDFCLPSEVILPKLQILAKVSDELKMSVGKMVVISAGKHSSRIAPVDTDLFPTIRRDFDYSAGVSFDVQGLISAVKKTVAIADPKSPFPALEGVYFNEGDIVSADGTKIALLRDVELFGESVLVHAVSLSKIAKAIEGTTEASIFIEGEKVVVFWSGGIVSSSTINYEFPDYKQLIPEGYETEFKVDREDLINSIGLATTEALDSENLLVIDAHEEALLIQASSPQGVHNSEIDYIEFRGPAKRFGISIKYVKDALAKIKTPVLYIGINTTNGLVVFHDGLGYKYGIMPMHIRE